MSLPNLPPGSHICIIGGGSSGVFAIREVLKAGFQPTLYNAADSSGGVWNSNYHWTSLTTNSSYQMMEVCGFPFPFQPSGVFPSRSEICDYVTAFIDKFQLAPYIHNSTTVVDAAPTTTPGGTTTWTITTCKHNIYLTSYFDAVIVASGQFNTPKLPFCLTPNPLAQSGYAGQVLHSRDFRSGKDFEDKHILVLGLGNSSLDVALECATVGNAASVTIACRRGSIFLPIRKDDGNAVDQHILTRFFQNVQPKMLNNYRMMAEAQTVTKAFIKAGMPLPSTGGRHAGLSQRVSNLKEKEQWLHLLTQKDGSRVSLWPSGLQAVGPGLKCTFFDGSTMDNVDVIISCTGYVLGHFPFLNQKDVMADCTEQYVVNSISATEDTSSNASTLPPPTAVTALNLYRRIMHPVHPTLCFLAQFTGFANEAACAQLQARWICNTWRSSSTLSLKVLELECAKRREFWQRSKPLFPQFVTVTRYLDVLASDIGCMPPKITSMWTWLSDPYLAWHLLFGPIVPAQYSLQGHDVTKEVARLSRDLIVGRHRRSRL